MDKTPQCCDASFWIRLSEKQTNNHLYYFGSSGRGNCCQQQYYLCLGLSFELFILKKVTDHTYDAAAQVAKRGRKRGLQIDEREMCDYEKVIPITCNAALVLI